MSTVYQYTLLIDYGEAFHSFPDQAVIHVMRQYGVEDKNINILKETYKRGMTQIRIEMLGSKIRIIKGV
jgi:hypothetical protein